MSVISVLFLLCFHARLFIDALLSPAGKGLTFWLSFVMSNCDVVTFPLVSCVRCGAGLYQFLIFALFLTLSGMLLYFNDMIVDTSHVSMYRLKIHFKHNIITLGVFIHCLVF